MIDTGTDMAEAVDVSVLSLEGCRWMCQDGGMMKCVFVQGSAQQHLLKMNIRLETPESSKSW